MFTIVVFPLGSIITDVFLDSYFHQRGCCCERFFRGPGIFHFGLCCVIKHWCLRDYVRYELMTHESFITRILKKNSRTGAPFFACGIHVLLLAHDIGWYQKPDWKNTIFFTHMQMAFFIVLKMKSTRTFWLRYFNISPKLKHLVNCTWNHGCRFPLPQISESDADSLKHQLKFFRIKRWEIFTTYIAQIFTW